MPRVDGDDVIAGRGPDAVFACDNRADVGTGRPDRERAKPPAGQGVDLPKLCVLSLRLDDDPGHARASRNGDRRSIETEHPRRLSEQGQDRRGESEHQPRLRPNGSVGSVARDLDLQSSAHRGRIVWWQRPLDRRCEPLTCSSARIRSPHCTGLMRRRPPGTGRLTFVSGEAGVGKTTLVRSFDSAARHSARVLVGACDPLAAPRPLGPFIEIGEETGSRLGELVREGGRAHEVALALVDELERRPTILVLEDLHWADEATLDVVRLLGRRIEAHLRLRRRAPIATTSSTAPIRSGCCSASSRRLRSGTPQARAAVARRGDAARRGEPARRRALSTAGRAGTRSSSAPCSRRATARSPRPCATRSSRERRDSATGRRRSSRRSRSLRRVSSRGCSTRSAATPATRSTSAWRRDCSTEIDRGVGVPPRAGAARSRGARSRRSASALCTARVSRRSSQGRVRPTSRGSPTTPTRPATATRSCGSLRRQPRVRQRSEPIARPPPSTAGRFAGPAASPGRTGRPARASGRRLLQHRRSARLDRGPASRIECHRRPATLHREVNALSSLVPRLACPGLMNEAEAAAREAVALADSLPPCREQGSAYSAMALYCLNQDDLDEAIAWGSRAAEVARRFADEEMLIDALITVGTCREHPRRSRRARDARGGAGSGAASRVRGLHPAGAERSLVRRGPPSRRQAWPIPTSRPASSTAPCPTSTCGGSASSASRSGTTSIRGRWDAAAELGTLLATRPPRVAIATARRAARARARACTAR